MNLDLKDIIPKSWEIKRLGDFVITEKGKKPKNISNKYNDIYHLPYVNIKAFEKNIIDEYTDGVGCVLCEEDDFVMVWDGSRSGYVGKAIKGTLGSTLVRIKFPGIYLDYAYYFLQSKYLEINTRAKGVGIPHVDPALLWSYHFPIPPFPEQHRIVAKIEELFSRLDKGIESLKTAQQQLKVYRQAVLKWAFEGKLTNKNVKEGELPEGWKWVKIGEISNVVRGGSPRPAGDPKYYGGKIPFLKVADITKDNSVFLYTFSYTIKEAGLHKTRKISPNTLLLSNSGATLGIPKICMIDATMNDGIAAFLDLDERSNLYLFYFWMSKTHELRNINMGAAQPNLNTDIIKNYVVPYCSFETQKAIVAEIESRLSVCDKIEESIEQSLKQSEALRQSILKKAFEGKLVPQDPSDEPASKLLERIKAEKEKTAIKKRSLK
ncbi:MAG: restriction endonuclease subunit S [Proteobacteria bacterium]|nr:restriction endonuclease subunit S [Pseudomonadota bacterium]